MRRLTVVFVLTCLAPAVSGCVGMAAAGRAGGGQPGNLGRIFDSADENHDGVITRTEFQDTRMRLFIRLDHNGDGYIDKSDASGGPLRRRKFEQIISGVVGRMDKDGDGRVSREEFQNAPALMFDRVDTNHDGAIDAQELAAFHARAASR
jgi:Ca2+-binding EF-hand superfamily protein